MMEELKSEFEAPQLQLNGKAIPPESDFLDKFEDVQFPHMITLT